MLRALSALVVVLSLATGCAGKNPPTIEGQIAQGGRRVIAAADSVLSGVDQLVNGGTLTKEDATRIVEIIQRVGKEGERLSAILTTVDTSKDALTRSHGLTQAGEILKLIQNLVMEAGAGISPASDKVRPKVLEILSGITAAVIDIAMLLQPTS